jgi:hypothetical protein
MAAEYRFTDIDPDALAAATIARLGASEPEWSECTAIRGNRRDSLVPEMERDLRPSLPIPETRSPAYAGLP